MKIAQFYENKRISLGTVDDHGFLTSLDFAGDMMDFLVSAPVCGTSGSPIPVEDVILAPPLSRPGKIIGIGRNYLEHIQEAHREVPRAPMIFAKFSTALIGHKSFIHPMKINDIKLRMPP